MIEVLAIVLVLVWLWWSLFFKKLDLSKYKDGERWALVTGASDGIGLAYAQELVEHGFKVYMVGRNREKLERVRLRGCEIIVSDASQPFDADYILEQVKHPIAILVNNVGMALGVSASFETASFDQIQRMITVNCTYPVLLTKALLPRLETKALVINIASIAGLTVTPFNAVYGATKAFSHAFSLNLSAEYPHLDVLSVCPGRKFLLRTSGNEDDRIEGVLVGAIRKRLRQGFFGESR